MDQLWDFAKQIAQSDGRKNDWIYVMDTYKSIGGNKTRMEIYGEGGRFEVLGETNNKNVLVKDQEGNEQTMSKDVYRSFKKKFIKEGL